MATQTKFHDQIQEVSNQTNTKVQSKDSLFKQLVQERTDYGLKIFTIINDYNTQIEQTKKLESNAKMTASFSEQVENKLKIMEQENQSILDKIKSVRM